MTHRMPPCLMTILMARFSPVERTAAYLLCIHVLMPLSSKSSLNFSSGPMSLSFSTASPHHTTVCASQASKLFDSANQTAAEAVHSIRTVAAFSLQVQVSRLYEQQLVEPTKNIEKTSHTSGLGFGFSQFVIFAVYALGFWWVPHHTAMTTQSINRSIYLMSWGPTGTQQTRSSVQ